jgi:metal-dependent amidase/aminoacylase/carboxypeptidase family protein
MIDEIRLFGNTYVTDIEKGINKHFKEQINNLKEEYEEMSKASDKINLTDIMERYENDDEMISFIKTLINKKEGKPKLNPNEILKTCHPKHLKMETKPSEKPKAISKEEKKTLYIIGAEIETKNSLYSVLAPKYIYTDKDKALVKLGSLLAQNKDKVFLFAVKEGEEIHPISM